MLLRTVPVARLPELERAVREATDRLMSCEPTFFTPRERRDKRQAYVVVFASDAQGDPITRLTELFEAKL